MNSSLPCFRSISTVRFVSRIAPRGLPTKGDERGTKGDERGSGYFDLLPAARIESLTTGGEVLISEQVHQRLAGTMRSRSWGTVELRGTDSEHKLFELITA